MPEQSWCAAAYTLCHLSGVAFKLWGGICAVRDFVDTWWWQNLSRGRADGLSFRRAEPSGALRVLLPVRKEGSGHVWAVCISGCTSSPVKRQHRQALWMPLHTTFPSASPGAHSSRGTCLSPATCCSPLLSAGTAGAVAHLCLWGGEGLKWGPDALGWVEGAAVSLGELVK